MTNFVSLVNALARFRHGHRPPEDESVWEDAPPWAVEIGWLLHRILSLLAGSKAAIAARLDEDVVTHQPSSSEELNMAQSGTLTIKSTEIHTIPLGLINEVDGSTQPLPAGDTLTATSSDPAVGAEVNMTGAPDGGPALVVHALTLPTVSSASVSVEVTDSAGNVAYTLTVSYPVPVVDDITADLASDVVTEQPAPTI